MCCDTLGLVSGEASGSSVLPFSLDSVAAQVEVKITVNLEIRFVNSCIYHCILLFIRFSDSRSTQPVDKLIPVVCFIVMIDIRVIEILNFLLGIVC